MMQSGKGHMPRAGMGRPRCSSSSSRQDQGIVACLLHIKNHEAINSMSGSRFCCRFVVVAILTMAVVVYRNIGGFRLFTPSSHDRHCQFRPCLVIVLNVIANPHPPTPPPIHPSIHPSPPSVKVKAKKKKGRSITSERWKRKCDSHVSRSSLARALAGS